MKWEDMIYFALVATLWRAASKNWNTVYHYEECCLLPWVVYVSQGFSIVLMMDRLHFIEEFLFWRNVLMKHSDVELWTAEMSFQYNVSLMNDIRRWIFCYWMDSFVKTFILLWREMLLLQRLLMEHFSSSVHHLPHFQPVRRTFIISSHVLTMKTSASRLLLKLCIVIDNISSRLRETV